MRCRAREIVRCRPDSSPELLHSFYELLERPWSARPNDDEEEQDVWYDTLENLDSCHSTQYLPLNLSSLRVSLCFYLSSLIHKATALISITTVRIEKKTCKEYTPAGAGWDSFIDHTL